MVSFELQTVDIVCNIFKELYLLLLQMQVEKGFFSGFHESEEVVTHEAEFEELVLLEGLLIGLD